MSPPDQRLEDLAVLYVGLAHGTDGRLHFNEFTQIADHLRRWRHPGDRRDVLDLVDRCVGGYRADQLAQAVHRLRDTLSTRELGEVMEDLSEIALADRRFLREEAEYILWVAGEWEIDQSDHQGGALSSVLRAARAGL